MNSGTAGKYAASVAIAFLLVVLMKITGVQEFWFGLQIATLILVLSWIITLLPDAAKSVKTAIMVLIATIAILAFVMPLILRLTMSPSVQRSWETGSIAQRLGLSRWLYDPAARGREASEEHCRDENERLTNGEKTSEIGKTLEKIEDLVRTYPDMDILMTAPKLLEEMSLREVLAQQNSTHVHERYRALQRKLQIQRDNAVAEYKRCMGLIPRPEVAATAPKEVVPPSATTATAPRKILDFGEEVGKFTSMFSGITWRQLTENSMAFGYSIAGILFVLSILFAIVRFHKMVNFLFYMALFCAIATTILWLGGTHG